MKEQQTAKEWQAEWQEGMERDESGICACRQVVLIGNLANAEKAFKTESEIVKIIHTYSALRGEKAHKIAKAVLGLLP